MKRVIATLMMLTAACSGPEDIIQEAAEAARDGDHAAYVACFTQRSRAFIETYWEAARARNPALAELGATDNVEVEGVVALPARGPGPTRVVATVTEGDQRMRVVVHEEAGIWRIDLLDTEQELMGFSSR